MENNGEEQLFKAGETIYEEGAESDCAYLILEGKIDILRSKDGAFYELGTLEAGSLFGEAGVLQNDVRSTTVRAHTDARLLIIPGDTFRRTFSDPLAKHVVTAMAKRLRDRYVPERELIQNSEIKAVYKKKPKTAMQTGDPVVEGVTPLVLEKLVAPVRILNFPFFIGNSRAPGEMARESAQSLMFPLPSAPDLEPQHFEFVKHGKEVWVRDLGTKHGTVVNGEIASKFGKQVEIKLTPGENIVGTGGMNSKVTFLITL
ncbi:cyclic nucleotide-binding domain-containing protein [Kordiimonas sp. SCSIO 12603]|uniref:cyclic nucleotide-binding domain-containing protein n=1 Tax=Kordiimonas sp. SCSIO 12603 TaxID=2829596 RepID=UPI002104E57A|nr:cyclic nucleotide-binding domain-containing protein [Kordiimonas sp. SCSIO 12603]UTW57430.1 cyclic nucleotide-binding domain-containing protein [Kordiimonas sp. SCSIO 12603]